MKIFILLLLACLPVFSQIGQIHGHINLDYPADSGYLTVEIVKDSIIKSSKVDEEGNFKIFDLPYGTYLFKISQVGDRGHREALSINQEITTLNLVYPNCPFAKKDVSPKCLNGHQDQIIPTVYGLPTKKTIKKAKKGLLHLGGCEIYDDCNSYYFCKIHKKDL